MRAARKRGSRRRSAAGENPWRRRICEPVSRRPSTKDSRQSGAAPDPSHRSIVVHLHGGHVPVEQDGHAMDYILPSGFHDYYYPNSQIASTSSSTRITG
jgi:hypothetical protein